MLKPESLFATAIIAALVALGPLATDMYLPAMPIMREVFATDINQIQMTLSLFIVGFAIGQLIYGPLSDRFGRKPVLLSGILLFSCSSLAAAFVTSIETLIILRIVQAIGGSAGPVIGRAMVRDIYGPRRSGRVLSYIGTAMALAPAVAPIMGGYMTVWWGWASVFLFLAAYGVVGIFVLGAKIPETLSENSYGSLKLSSLSSNYMTLLRHKQWLGYTLSCSFIFAGLFCFLSGAPFVIIEYFGFPAERFGLLFIFIVVGYVCGTLIAGRLSYSLGTYLLVRYGSILSAVAGSIMALLAWSGVDHVAAVIAPHVFFMIGVGIVMPQAMAGAMAPFPYMAGTASALLGFGQMLIAASAGAMVGLFHDGSPRSMATGIAAMGICSFVSFLLLARNYGQPETETAG